MSILLQLISSILILISATVFNINNATFQSVDIGIRITDINIKYQYRYCCQFLSSLSIDIDADYQTLKYILWKTLGIRIKILWAVNINTHVCSYLLILLQMMLPIVTSSQYRCRYRNAAFNIDTSNIDIDIDNVWCWRNRYRHQYLHCSWSRYVYWLKHCSHYQYRYWYHKRGNKTVQISIGIDTGITDDININAILFA